MTTFKQFLREAEYENNALKHLLEDDCEHFLKEVKGDGFLIRGMRKLSRAKEMSVPHPFVEDAKIKFWEQSVRLDRQPTSTNDDNHEMFDDWFYRAFGIRARSQAIFCFGDSTASRREIESTYGKPYVIFPIGTFRYVWSRRVQDLYGDTDGRDWYLSSDGEEDDQDPEEMVSNYLYDQDYTTKGLDAAVRTRSEIMVECAKYYAFTYEDADILKMIGI